MSVADRARRVPHRWRLPEDKNRVLFKSCDVIKCYLGNCFSVKGQQSRKHRYAESFPLFNPNIMVCWASALWYLSISRPTSTYVSHMSVSIRKTVKPHKNITFTNIRTRPLNPHTFEFVINEPKKCESVTPFLVILISTTHKEFDARQAIRETWGDESTFSDIRILTIFLLGINTDAVLNQMVEQESQIFHDIVVENFIDSYHNLTLKTMMGMRWVATFCPKAQYVMKTDSDIFVNMDNLIYKLLKPTTKPRRRYFTGYVINGGPIRDMRSKWYMPRDLYPENKYPPFCSGTGYVFQQM
ncbi:hypothetical protein INR49_005357 [Caranx melampygus]|nr:hypothetical protein INR49_005357 [Caranx melampygus]